MTDNGRVQTLQPIVADDVAQALDEGRAVVALESTIFSNLGLPALRTPRPSNSASERSSTKAPHRR